MALLGLYLVACALLVAAGLMKVVRPHDTARALAYSFSRWPSRSGPAVVRCAALAEAGLGVVALIGPARPLAVGVACSYAAFGVFVIYARSRGGPLATCGCFGAADTPPTVLHVVVDAVLLVATVSVAVSLPPQPVSTTVAHQYGHGVPLVAASAVAAWLCYLVLAPLARLGALRAMRPVNG
jgi:methylamine utilization protein MauE